MNIRTIARFAALAGIIAPLSAYAAAKGFDPDAATQAYLDTLKGAARAKSDAYFEGGYWLLLWGTLAAVLAELLVLSTGLSARFRDWAERVTQRKFLQYILYALPYGAFGTLVLLPWTIYTGFIRERQYDLMNQSFAGWLGDALKDVAVDLVIFPLLIMAIYGVIRRFPRNWWIGGTAVVGLFTIIGMMLAPVYIAPLFNKYVELPAGPVRDQWLALLQAMVQPAPGAAPRQAWVFTSATLGDTPDLHWFTHTCGLQGACA